MSSVSIKVSPEFKKFLDERKKVSGLNYPEITKGVALTLKGMCVIVRKK